LTEFSRERLKAARKSREETVTVREALDRLSGEEYELPASLRRLEEHSYPLEPPTDDIMVVPSTLLGVLKAKPAFIFQISHRQFEELIRDILRSMGFDVHLTAQTRDGGCDLIAVSRDVLGIQTKYVIEAKHYAPTNKVGVQLVRQLNTVRIREGAHHGVLVTSSYFTRDALAENRTFYGLQLKDYDALVEWIKGA
jgi:restriction system protein